MQRPSIQTRPLKVALAGVLVLTVSLLGLGSYLGTPIVFAASVYWLLLLVLMVGTLRQHRSIEAPDRYLPAARMGLSALVLAEAAIGHQLLTRGLLAPREATDFLVGPELLMVGATVAMFGLGMWFHARQASGGADEGGLAKVCRLGVWLGLIGFGACVVPSEFAEMTIEPIALLLLAVPGVLATELMIRGLVAFFSRPQAGAPFGADLVSARVFGSAYNPVQSILNAIDTTFDVDVRGSWALGFLRAVAPPILAGFGLVVWGLSSVVVVDASQHAVRERFGKVDPALVLPPGLVVGLPWPFDQVRRVDVTRVRSVPLGYTKTSPARLGQPDLRAKPA